MVAGEFELIDRIRQRAANGAGLRIGIGDDCSVIDLPPQQELLTSMDLLLEGVHFRLDWTDLHRLGRKAVSVNISDIAAMGGRPLYLYLGLGIPPGFDEAQLDQFLDGVMEALEEYKTSLAGGDTCRSATSLTLSVCIQGVCPAGQSVCRDGALPGEDIWVSGSLGDSGLALKKLQEGLLPEPQLAERHFNPRARCELGQELGLRRLATAMLDLSDGLMGDLGHLLRASGCGARIELEKLPLSGSFRRALKSDPSLLDLAIGAGEDYELLFTARSADRQRLEELAIELKLPLLRIGCITTGSELEFRTAQGQIYQPGVTGYNHFSVGRRSENDRCK